MRFGAKFSKLKLLKDCLESQNTSSVKIPSHFLNPRGQIDFFSEIPSSFLLVHPLENVKTTKTLSRMRIGEN